jgi:hypothetical protein
MACVPQTVQALEQRYGVLTPLGGGYSSRVYAAGHLVLKVYHTHNGLHELEAANMRRAGLGAWVVETLELAPSALPGASRLEPADVLVTRRFAGHPVIAADLPKALPELGAFLRQLHATRGEVVNLEALQAKLERFDAALSTLPIRRDLEPLFDCVRSALESGALNVPKTYCSKRPIRCWSWTGTKVLLTTQCAITHCFLAVRSSCYPSKTHCTGFSS